MEKSVKIEILTLIKKEQMIISEEDNRIKECGKKFDEDNIKKNGEEK